MEEIIDQPAELMEHVAALGLGKAALKVGGPGLAQQQLNPGRGRSRPALNGRVHASAACCSLFRAVRDARDLVK